MISTDLVVMKYMLKISKNLETKLSFAWQNECLRVLKPLTIINTLHEAMGLSHAFAIYCSFQTTNSLFVCM